MEGMVVDSLVGFTRLSRQIPFREVTQIHGTPSKTHTETVSAWALSHRTRRNRMPRRTG